mgnify:CR=1 FL=1
MGNLLSAGLYRLLRNKLFYVGLGIMALLQVYLLESDGFTHDVRLEDVLADLHFYREYLRAEAVEHNKLLVVVVVEKSPLGNKSVV